MNKDVARIFDELSSALYGAGLDADTLVIATREMAAFEDIADLNKSNIDRIATLVMELEETLGK